MYQASNWPFANMALAFWLKAALSATARELPFYAPSPITPANICFCWPFARDIAEILRTAPTSAKLSLAHGDFYFACERDQRKCE
jgi:hypothetical protein